MSKILTIFIIIIGAIITILILTGKKLFSIEDKDKSGGLSFGDIAFSGFNVPTDNAKIAANPALVNKATELHDPTTDYKEIEIKTKKAVPDSSGRYYYRLAGGGSDYSYNPPNTETEKYYIGRFA